MFFSSKVGAGKSSLVSALLGHMYRNDGRVDTVDSVAYVPQQPWIQNDTVRNNILFGKPMDWDRYHEIVCCSFFFNICKSKKLR
jgi:ATP-binding cassette subfamily C (CFTR/MRP) protein 1